MEDAGIYAREATYLDRYVQFGHASGKLLSVSFPTEPDDNAEPEHPLLDRIGAYLEGASDDFDDVEVALTLPTDRRGVLESLRQVPYGENVTVAELARMTAGLVDGEADDHQLVREALAANPAPLVVGDHRVRDGPSAAPPEVEQRLRSLEGL
ncbi:MGMT family protein [Halosegnis marinus]|uniref:MGMT family protein n=1 Tax=Halosegnis marinus TaxID=3034023 RepID=A0ABD5ZQL0_9EURY|nr:MGMT family protein [Halosegnis sp. DT85]